MKPSRSRLTPADQAYIRDHWATETAQQIADVIGKDPGTIRQHAYVVGLRKDPLVLSEIRRACGGMRPDRSEWRGR